MDLLIHGCRLSFEEFLGCVLFVSAELRRMSNIHTYEDLKDKPNASPLPDPWRKSKRQSGTIASFDDEAQLPDSEQRYLRVATLGGVSACRNQRFLIACFLCFCARLLMLIFLYDSKRWTFQSIASASGLVCLDLRYKTRAHCSYAQDPFFARIVAYHYVLVLLALCGLTTREKATYLFSSPFASLYRLYRYTNNIPQIPF